MRWKQIHDFRTTFSENELRASATTLPWYTLRRRMPFYPVHLHPANAPAHDCNHNYVARNRQLLRLIFHEITGSVPGFLHRSTSPRLIQRTAASPDFLSEASRYQNIHPTKACHRKKGEHQRCWFTGRRPPGKMDQAIALQGSRCRALHHASWIIVASEDVR